MWSLVNRHSNGQPTRCKCIPCWKKWYSIFHCHVSWPEIPQIILVIVSNEDPPFRPQRCKEQQEVLERENQSLKQAPGVKGYAQHGGLPAVFWNASNLIKQILKIYTTLGYAQKTPLLCFFVIRSLNETVSLTLGKNWQNPKVDDEGSLGSWFSQGDRWNFWKLVEIQNLKHWNVEGHWDVSMFQTFCSVILCTVLTISCKKTRLITHTWNHLKSGLCSYQHDLLGGGFKYFSMLPMCVSFSNCLALEMIRSSRRWRRTSHSWGWRNPVEAPTVRDQQWSKAPGWLGCIWEAILPSCVGFLKNN